MANKQLFNFTNQRVKPANTVNEAGGKAYAFSYEHALCQYVVTGTFGGTYYASDKEQLEKVKTLVENVSPEMIAKAAVYGHQVGKMKDIPAYLLAVLAAKGELELLSAAWPKVITTPKMLLNFVQIVRSGQTGRRSFGSAVKKLIQDWITSRYNDKLFVASIGYSNPSVADVIKMVHPRPTSLEQSTLFAYLLGKDYVYDNLPGLVQEFEAFKEDNTKTIPNLDYRALTNCNLTKAHWEQIASNMPWNTLRMNLNKLEREGVFGNAKLVSELAATLGNREEVIKWNAFPYQLMTTYQNVGNVPQQIQLALQDALEVATENVPAFNGHVTVAIDISGSMGSPVTGSMSGHSTVTTCRDVAALVGACVLKKNPDARVFGWDTSIYETKLNPRDSVLTNAKNLNCHGGGTDASVALKHLNDKKKKSDLIIYVSDNESWYSSTPRKTWGYSGTGMAQEWQTFKKNNKGAKLVCIDVQPYGTTQVVDDKDVLNIGGFNDSVFKVIEQFVNHGNTDFVKTVKATEL